MIYRAPAKPGSSSWELLGSELEVRDRLATLRVQHDELAARVDALGLELAEEQGRWFKKADVIGALQERYDRESVQLARLVDEERAFAAQLAELAAAKTELAGLVTKAGSAIAGLDDPLGAEYRRIAEALRVEEEALAQQELVLAAAERAETALAAVRDAARAVEAAGSIFRGVAEAVAEELFATRDRTTQRARLAELLPYAAVELGTLVTAARLGNLLVGTFDAVDAAIEDPVERSRLAREAPEILERVANIVATVATGAAEIRHRRSALVQQQAILVANFMSR